MMSFSAKTPMAFFKTPVVLQVIVLRKWDEMDLSRHMCKFGPY